MKQVPVCKDEKGEDWGTINQQLATWCISQGFEVEIHTADFQVIDLSWSDLNKNKLLERMEATKEGRDVVGFGKEWSSIYMQCYIDFVKAGGKLNIRPYMTTELIDSLLLNGPLLACVCYNVLYNYGRREYIGLRESIADDINGKLTNHSIVIYGKNQGKYLISDPWEVPGKHAIEPERMICAMTAAQMECDNLLFQLKDKDIKR